jgi:hypothetical protein
VGLACYRTGRKALLCELDGPVQHLARNRIRAYAAYVLHRGLAATPVTEKERKTPYLWTKDVYYRTGTIPYSNQPIYMNHKIESDAALYGCMVQECTEFPALGRELVYLDDKKILKGEIVGFIYGRLHKANPKGDGKMCYEVDPPDDRSSIFNHPRCYLTPHPACSMMMANDPMYGAPKEAGKIPNVEITRHQQRFLCDQDVLHLKVMFFCFVIIIIALCFFFFVLFVSLISHSHLLSP